MHSPPKASAGSSGQNNERTTANADGLVQVRRTRRWFVVCGGVVAILAFAFWGPIRLRCTTYFLLRGESPSEEALSQIMGETRNPGPLLEALWNTQRIPHRKFVLAYLNRIVSSDPGLFRQVGPMLLQATTDPDIEVRQLAFTALARLKHPQVRQLALAQLSDADPAVRLMGLQSLRRVATSNEVHLTVRFLEDPDPRVVVAAIMVLQRATAQNFGIKSSDALPQFTCIDTNPPPAPDLPTILKGVQQCQRWWSLHKGQYQSSVPSLPQTQTMRLPAPDFVLKDSVGNEVRLRKFLGKNVLLFFWSPGAPASLDDVSALKSLQEKQRDRLAVLGICIPAAPNCADEHADTGELGTKPVQHHSHESCAPPQTAAQLRTLARQVSDGLKINFPMLVDPQFTVGGRFDADDLPLYVLVDSHGTIRRRFVGFRSERALSAMVAETDNPSQMMK